MATRALIHFWEEYEHMLERNTNSKIQMELIHGHEQVEYACMLYIFIYIIFSFGLGFFVVFFCGFFWFFNIYRGYCLHFRRFYKFCVKFLSQ